VADQLNFALSTDVAKAVAGLNKTVASQAEVIKKLQETQAAGKKSEEGMGALTGAFARFATVGGTVTAVVGTVKMGLTELDRIGKAAADRIADLERSIKSLVQISATPEENQRLEALAKQIATATGIKEAGAQAIVQRGMSLGLTEKDILRLSQSKQFEEDPMRLIEAVGDIRGIFGNAVSSEGVVNSLLAGQKTTKLNAGELSKLALAPSQIAKELGGTLPEAIALTAVGVQGAKSPESGATQMESLLKKFLTDEKKRFEGLGVAGAIDKFLAMTKEDQDALVAGEKEALLGAAKVRANPQQFKTVLADVQGAIGTAGTPQSLFETQLGIAQQNPRIRALSGRQQAEERLRVAEEPAGIEEDIQQAIIARMKAALIERGVGAVGRLIASAGLSIDDLFNTRPEVSIAMAAQNLPGSERKDFSREMLDFLKSISVNTANNQKALDERARKPGPRGFEGWPQTPKERRFWEMLEEAERSHPNSAFSREEKDRLSMVAARNLPPGPRFDDALDRIYKRNKILEDAGKLLKEGAMQLRDNARKPVRVGELE